MWKRSNLSERYFIVLRKIRENESLPIHPSYLSKLASGGSSSSSSSSSGNKSMHGKVGARSSAPMASMSRIPDRLLSSKATGLSSSVGSATGAGQSNKRIKFDDV